MEIKVDALDLGTIVFVSLGYLTVKQGKISGHRVTLVGLSTEVEYLVRWFGPEDRPQSEEWFPSRVVYVTSVASFGHP